MAAESRTARSKAADVGGTSRPLLANSHHVAATTKNSPKQRYDGATKRDSRNVDRGESAMLAINSAGHNEPTRWPETSKIPWSTNPIPQISAATRIPRH